MIRYLRSHWAKCLDLIFEDLFVNKVTPNCLSLSRLLYLQRILKKYFFISFS